MSCLFIFLYSAFVVVYSLSCVRLFATPWIEHTRLPCPLLSPRVCSDSCPLSWWCHPTILSSVISFSSCLHSFPASGSFPMSQFFTPGGQSIGVSASASVLPMNIQDWFSLGLTGLISLQSNGLSRIFYNTTVWKASILWSSAFFRVQLSHLYMTAGKIIALTIQASVGKVVSLLFIILPRLVIAFLPRSKHLLISWVHSPFAVILEPKKIKFITGSIASPSICHDLHFLNVEC